MKPFLLSTAFLALAAVSTAQAQTLAPTDTIVVKLPNQAVMMLMVRDAQQLRQLPQYHLDSLVARLGGYIKQTDEAAKTANGDQVTRQFYPDKDHPGQGLPDQIRVTTRQPQGSRSTDVEVGHEVKPRVSVGRDDEDRVIIIRSKKNRAGEVASADSARHSYGADRHIVKFCFDYGLSFFTNNANHNDPEVPNLYTKSSGYFNFGLHYVQPLHYTKQSRLGLTVGPDFIFSDFHLPSSHIWTTNSARTTSVATPSNMQVDYSRLLVTTLNLPIMAELKLLDKRQKRTLTAGLGGFVGVRLHSSIQTRYNVAGNDNDLESLEEGKLHVNDFQYGAQAELGFIGLRFIARYNFNELFESGQGPKTHMMSVGIMLFGF
ncbi:MAG: hypothetical protein ACRYFX_31175 [Janthinobacterium lividum]